MKRRIFGLGCLSPADRKFREREGNIAEAGDVTVHATTAARLCEFRTRISANGFL